MAIAQYNLIFNCTPAQFATAMATTLPAAGLGIIQAPIAFQGLIRFLPYTFNGTLNSTTAVTGITSTSALYAGEPVTGTGIPAGTTITPTGATTATLSQAATVTATEPLTATPTYSEIDFSYDGQFFLRFFDANMSAANIAQLTTILAATLGAPVPSATAVPPYSSNLL